MKKGLELEFWVIDEDGYLTTAEDIIDDNDDLVVQEFVEPLLEIKTDPYADDAAIKEATKERLEAVLASAESADKQLVPLGTPLVQEDMNLIESKRGIIQHDVLGENVKYAMNVAGTHIHYDQTNLTRQLRLLTALDPVIAALHSSPFHGGKNIAAGARTEIYRYRCYEDLPKHGQLWSYPDSREEWETRVQKRHEEFKELALEEGYDEETFEKHFSPSESVWIPIRVRDSFGTVEWRAPDISLPSQIFPFLEQINALVEHVKETPVAIGDGPSVETDQITVPSFETVEEHVRKAIVHGLEHEDVRSYCEDFGLKTARFEPLTHELQSHVQLTHDKGRMLRMRYADRLEQDIDQL